MRLGFSDMEEQAFLPDRVQAVPNDPRPEHFAPERDDAERVHVEPGPESVPERRQVLRRGDLDLYQAGDSLVAAERVPSRASMPAMTPLPFPAAPSASALTRSLLVRR